jgi:hypothetical protein
MKSRRRTVSPETQDRANIADYIRDSRLVKWGSGISLHGSNPEPPMSALGQKRTFGLFIAMSALPPKADIGSRDPDVRFVPKADIYASSGAPCRR